MVTAVAPVQALAGELPSASVQPKKKKKHDSLCSYPGFSKTSRGAWLIFSWRFFIGCGISTEPRALVSL